MGNKTAKSIRKQAELAHKLHRCACALVLFAVVIITGCASTYGLKENWVDDDDMQTILAEPDINKVATLLGTPVFTEYRGDTVEFVYNYRPHHYKSVLDGRDFKPVDKDRVDLWSVRTELVGIMVVNGRVVGIRPRPDYMSDQNVASVTQKSYFWVVLLGILAAAGIITILIVTD